MHVNQAKEFFKFVHTGPLFSELQVARTNPFLQFFCQFAKIDTVPPEDIYFPKMNTSVFPFT